MLAAYDYPTAKILCRSGIDMILVGDSLGVMVLGQGHTRGVTLNDIIRHTAAVVRGSRDCMVIADMPLNTTDTAGTAISNCRTVMKETGAHAVKVEKDVHIVEALTAEGIPVMGHAGLMPQSADDVRLCGTDRMEASGFLSDALAMEKAGAFALMLECIPSALGKKITSSLKIPTIGIGAGRYCDGQVQVVNDIIGLSDDMKLKFIRRYAEVGMEIEKAAKMFIKDVKAGEFPSDDESD